MGCLVFIDNWIYASRQILDSTTQTLYTSVITMPTVDGWRTLTLLMVASPHLLLGEVELPSLLKWEFEHEFSAESKLVLHVCSVMCERQCEAVSGCTNILEHMLALPVCITGTIT